MALSLTHKCFGSEHMLLAKRNDEPVVMAVRISLAKPTPPPETLGAEIKM